MIYVKLGLVHSGEVKFTYTLECVMLGCVTSSKVRSRKMGLEQAVD